MSEPFVQNFVEKLILLERETGAGVSYRVMAPFAAPFHDYMSIQKGAKQIAEFIGLAGFTFIIAVVKHEEKAAGHIDLATGGNEVFVEIDDDIMRYPDAVGATLCHEACHKWLQVHRIGSPIEAEDEILTDITAVFLGLGKVMLNGCKATSVKYETMPNGTRTITETRTFGYLDRDQLAFVYHLVCAMRNIPVSDYIQGLNVEATQAVRSCDSSFGHHYDGRFHRVETTQESINGFQERIIGLQRNLAELNKHSIYIRKSFCDTLDEFLKACHRKLKALRQKAAAITQETDLDPVMRFLRAIQNEFEIERMQIELEAVGQESETFLGEARAVGQHLFRHTNRFPPPSPHMFGIITCPQDGTRLRVPEESGDLIVTCPICKYRFTYTTAPLSFTEEPAFQKPTWGQWLRNLMKRKKKG